MWYQQEKNKLDPFIKDLYKLCLGLDCDVMKRLQVFFHIRDSDSGICKQLRGSPFGDEMNIYIGVDMTQINEEV